MSFLATAPCGEDYLLRNHDVLAKDTLVMDILVTYISVTGRFGNRTFW